MGRAPLWALLALPLAALVAAPLLAVLAAAAGPLGAASRYIAGTTLPEMLGNSALLALGVAAITALAGTVTAWLVTACRFPGRRVLDVALLLPMAMPAYVCGYAYTWLLDVAGPVQTAFRDATGLRWGQYWFPEIRSLSGAALMLGLVLYPYVYLLCRSAFAQQSLGLVEAARTLGQSLTGCFFRLALPMARPAIAGGVALALMETLADFGTVQHFGIRTFTTGVYEAWFSLGDRGAASQLAACLMGLAAMLLVFERLSRGGRRFHATTAREAPLRPVPLRGWRAAAACLACALPVALGFLVPAGTLLALLLQVGDPLAPERFLPFARNSVTLAGLAGLLAVLLAALLGWAARLHPRPAQRAALRVAGLGYALPGSVIAVGTLVPLGLFDNALDGWMRAHFGLSTGLLLSGGIAALVFAYLVRFLAVALSAVEAGLARLRPSLREAARSLGAGPAASVLRVELPLARGSLLTAGLLVFVDTMKELPATLIIRPFDFDTLAVRVHNLAADERLAEASTSALLIVAAGLLPVLALTRASRPR
ncbi:iron ABC transporter permease [Belnapia sp. F-4-1]|uniref:ABC transporter permease n=1 Tax=Belnapia sp. F-4-1 TaxID=1545443 RepID=UPI0005BDD4C6|nr:iron ABC transporter permease [Belnapia sp. F-4-1]